MTYPAGSAQVCPDDIRLPLTTPDPNAERLDRLRELFPEAFTEGELDLDRLKQAVGISADDRPERYGLSWAGKSDAIRAFQMSSAGTLRPVPAESVNFETTENVIIEGDNLEVLKLLQRSYHDRVKMIYIDPPYNTGNEFIYPDNFREGLQEYLRFTGQVDGEGARLTTNAETDGRYHSRWLSMMYPRLFLARNLLREDGVIFVSIDDHEVHNLRLLMNEIFGEENHIATFAWETKRAARGVPTSTLIIPNTEYVVCYGRGGLVRFRGEDRSEDDFSNRDNDPRGLWRSESMRATGSQNNHFDIVDPVTGARFPGNWAFSEKRIAEMIANGLVLFPATSGGTPRQKKFLDSYINETKAITTSLGWHSTENATKELMSLFSGDKVFDFPKPLSLIKTLIAQATAPGSTVLDFFAGSGTTAQAVLELNQEDGGNRKFILVQLPEATGKDDFPTIADLAKERVRRAVQKLEKGLDGKLALNAHARPDLGFRVFKLASSSFTLWDADAVPKDAEALGQQLELYADHLTPDRSELDILYELLLKLGLPLTVPIEERTLAGQRAYSVEGGRRLVCLEGPIAKETLRAMMELRPQQILCLDQAFHGDDALKTNIVLEMKSHDIMFHTV
ncbi:MAG TPA: site-specific DNA-methyltransferase [Armatimonadota bacterium]|nr:site-specific DNA-methyltransferase [Armatimonadota bacterium]